MTAQDATRRIRDAIRQRYVLLPYIYTLFRHANTTGVPVMRPLWFDFPEEPAAFAMDDEFMLGPGLLVRCLYCLSCCQTFHSMHCSVDMRARDASLVCSAPQGSFWPTMRTGVLLHVVCSPAGKSGC